MRDRLGRFKNLHLNFTPPSLIRAFALRRLAASDMSFPGVEFKIASSEEEMAGAFALLEQCYVRRGIAREGQMRLQVISLLPTTTTFVAREGKRIIGTLSLIEDSDLGLPMEKAHESEVADVRRLFRRVAEVGALAVSADQRRTGLSIMLYNMMYRWARNWRHVDDLHLRLGVAFVPIAARTNALHPHERAMCDGRAQPYQSAAARVAARCALARALALATEVAPEHAWVEGLARPQFGFAVEFAAMHRLLEVDLSLSHDAAWAGAVVLVRQQES